MTLEQAQALRPGDMISGAGNNERVLTKVWIEEDKLCWNQKGNGSTRHEYPYSKMSIVKKAEPVVINNYSIY